MVVLRVARFFPEDDDRDEVRAAYDGANVKANEYLYRRVDIQDVADAHLLAMAEAPAIGFGKYIISATTPFTPGDLAGLGRDAPAVVRRLFPDADAEYARRGWAMFPVIDRVYVNDRARAALGWRPRYDFRRVLDGSRPARTRAVRSPGRSGPRAITPSPPARTPSADSREAPHERSARRSAGPVVRPGDQHHYQLARHPGRRRSMLSATMARKRYPACTNLV